MLTDIFADRYSKIELWKTFADPERKLLVQAFRIVAEDLFPVFDNKGASIPYNVKVWKELEAQLSRELGHEVLASHFNGGYRLPINDVCRNFVLGDRDGSPDLHMKNRLSFIELAFRAKEDSLPSERIARPKKEGLAELASSLQTFNATLEGFTAAIETRQRREFADAVEELNERLAQSGTPLHYHSGFVQRTTDELVAKEVEEPFWALVSDDKWVNVVTDMKEAIDRRDNGDRDPALYAAKALESAIKVISDERGATTGRESGAANYIEGLASDRGGHFLKGWEASLVKSYFSNVRNPLGHGPGNSAMPVLDSTQTDWAIEYAMIWIKAMVGRNAA